LGVQKTHAVIEVVDDTSIVPRAKALLRCLAHTRLMFKGFSNTFGCTRWVFQRCSGQARHGSEDGQYMEETRHSDKMGINESEKEA
jgi:hypothetical protein